MYILSFRWRIEVMVKGIFKRRKMFDFKTPTYTIHMVLILQGNSHVLGEVDNLMC